MKTIIAPIDFSEASHNALLFAVEVARRSTSNLMVVNVSSKSDDEVIVKAKLDQVLDKLRNSAGGPLHCESFVEKGNLTDVLQRVSEEKKANLIVMGTKGASGLKRILIGSNTVKLLSKTKTPVLVIPESATFSNFLLNGKNRVVLATDLYGLKNMNVLNVVKEMALLMKEPKVRVLNVRPPHTELYEMTKLERSAMVHFFNPEINSESATVFGTSVMSGIRFYLDKRLRRTDRTALYQRNGLALRLSFACFARRKETVKLRLIYSINTQRPNV
jgi:nucleotide-binding universal stress UspA family protein